MNKTAKLSTKNYNLNANNDNLRKWQQKRGELLYNLREALHKILK